MNLRPSGYEPDELPDCSTPLLEMKNEGFCSGARDRVRTGDPQLGRLMLYQLSYSRSIILLKSANNLNYSNYLFGVGGAGFEPAKVKTNRFTVCPRWPLEYLPKLSILKN